MSDQENEKVYKSEEVNNKQFDILLESYRMADSQLQMRIQQRDNLGIQMMVAFGVLLSAMTIDNELLRRICIFAMPIIAFYFCNQVFSSYDVHSRLVYFIKNNVEFELKKNITNHAYLWEQFCDYERRFRKRSKLGGRKGHFMIINIGVPIIALLLYSYFFFIYDGSLLSLVSAENIIGVLYFVFWEIMALIESRKHRGDYQKDMFDLMAKRGYIDSNILKEKNVFNKAVFIDRDGTIHVDKVETHKIEDLEFFDDTVDFLISMNKLGYMVVIVTNQSGIGKGHYRIEEMQSFNDCLIRELQNKGVKVSALYYCPHINQDNCQCKKPKDGMFRRAAMELNVSLKDSIMVGDQSLDAYAGLEAGVGANYIVTTGIYKTPGNKYVLPDSLKGKVEVFPSLTGVANHIISTRKI